MEKQEGPIQRNETPRRIERAARRLVVIGLNPDRRGRPRPVAVNHSIVDQLHAFGSFWLRAGCWSGAGMFGFALRSDNG